MNYSLIIPIYNEGHSLKKLLKQLRKFDSSIEIIIIDDGSHISKDVITTFKFLFPKIRKGGWYVVEDIQTSYWKVFEGDPKDLANPRTSMNFFKQLTDSVNSSEFERDDGSDGTFDHHIDSIHFYYNMVFIKKK